MSFFDNWFADRPKPSDGGLGNSAQSAADASDFGTEDASRDTHLDGLRLWLKYQDTEGNKSERWVQVYRVESRQYADYLVAYCELRDQIRTFRLDRIAEVVDGHGEVHDPLEFFAPYIKRPEGRSAGPDRHTPFGRALHIIERMGDELRLLAFVAEADGSFGHKEANLIMRVAELRASDFGLELKRAELGDLRRWTKAQGPDATAMKAAIARMAKTGHSGDYEEVWSLVEIICEADGKIKPEEMVALQQIRTAMDEEFKFASSH